MVLQLGHYVDFSVNVGIPFVGLCGKIRLHILHFQGLTRMNAIRLSILVCLCLSLLPYHSADAQSDQKRSLTHDDYDHWQSIRGREISHDGNWVAFAVNPQVGDGVLVVKSTNKDVEYRVPRGSSPKFTTDGKFLAFSIKPTRLEMKTFERKKLKKPKKGEEGDKKKKEPKPEKPLPMLGIMDLADGKITKVERLVDFKVPEEGPSFVLYRLEPKKKEKKKDKKTDGKGKKASDPDAKKKGESEKSEKPKAKKEVAKVEAKKKEKKKEAKKEKKKDYHKEGKPLHVRDLNDSSEVVIPGVTSFGVVKKRGVAWYSCSSKKKDPKIGRGLFARQLVTKKQVTLVDGAADYKGVRSDREATKLVFVSNRRDRDAEKPTFDLWAWNFVTEGAKRIVSHVDTPQFPSGRSVDSSGSFSFSYDGATLMLSASLLPEEDAPKILSEEKVTLDIWHYKDPILQPMQAKRASRDRKASLSCVWHFDGSRLVPISRTPYESVRFLSPDGSYALIQDSSSYGPEMSWDGRYADIYVANTLDGNRRLIAKKLGGRMQSSPTGRYLTYFKDRTWYCVDVMTGLVNDLTSQIDVPFHNEDHDTPSPERAHGQAGWTENDTHVLLYDRFDIWKITADGSSSNCITERYGRANSIRLRYQRLDREERFIPKDQDLLLSASHSETMASGWYHDRLDGLKKPQRLVMKDMAFSRAQKAKDSDRLFFTLSTFRQTADLWTSDNKFTAMKQLSQINPQQKDIAWGNAEIVHWDSADGKPLKGILIKPDNFDPKKKYPMMVYFYERLSSRLHSYGTPAPGTSPNSAYYVSNGYLWFMPDIVYRDGYPGESCMKCVVSGVQSLIAKGFVDRDAIGAAGHSWGGYQTAYLVTKTNIFKAVESGAPVVNMTSAYGGIRWGSGMSRAFQYEKTQSRIGGSLWDYPLRYLENSPIFSADKVETPVLMMHNDKDGAVPWYQGIEYFSALRRLGKEVYMFDYVGADHGLRKRANQKDWTKRMQQYFDHHLRGAPMPEWMANGVPYIDRTKEKLRFLPPETLKVLASQEAAMKAAALLKPKRVEESVAPEKVVSTPGGEK
jgi:acetyl esterase/lipase